MTPKKPKKNLVEKKAKKSPIKEVKAPPVEIDIEFIHNLISAEVAIQLHKMDECEVRNFNYSNDWYWCSKDVKNIINLQQEKHLADLDKRWNIQQQYNKYLTRSIIASLWLWYSLSFIIN